MPKKPYHIIYEDDDILVVNKIAGIPVVKERNPNSKVVSIFDMLQNTSKDTLLLIHRIDKDTSGLLVIAKNQTSQKKISEAMLNHQIDKRYLAIVDGKLDQRKWKTIDAPILKRKNSFKVIIDDDGKTAKTRYRTIEVFRHATLVEIRILTGRTHQIRAHMAFLGNPLFVDSLYGRRDSFYLSEILMKKYKAGRDKIEKPLMERHTLHASSISFLHPKTNQMVNFEADIPKDFKALINQLRRLS